MAKDFYHEIVKRALEKDGWIITHDPFVIEFEGLRIFADLGAEKIIPAEFEENRIAIEVKVFGGKSKISEFEKALGQYELYHIYLSELEPERKLFLAVSEEVYTKFFELPAIKFAVSKKGLKIIVFDQEFEVIVKWIN